MTPLQWYLFLFFIGLPGALFVGYTIGIQYQRESWWLWVRMVCLLVAGVTMLLDVIAEWTVLSIYMFEFPEPGEYTFSDRLERLCLESGWRGWIGLRISRLLNWIAPPGHPHINNAIGK